MKKAKQLILVLVVSFLAGCMDYPDCYYSIFGCNEFEREFDPWYGADLTSPATKNRKIRTKKVDVAGDWLVNLTPKSSTCPVRIPSSSGIVEITQSARNVYLTIPNRGTFSGVRGRKQATFSGRYSDSSLPCVVNATINLTNIRKNSMSVSAAATATCGTLLNCRATFEGNGVRR